MKKVKSIPSGSGSDAVPVPKDFPGLVWLQQYMSHRPTMSNMSVNPVIHTYIHTYTLFNLEFSGAKEKLVSSSYKLSKILNTAKMSNYNTLKFNYKNVIL